MIPKIQMQGVSNGLRRLRIKTWRQYDVPCTVHKQISGSSTFKSETNHQASLMIEMKRPEQRQEPVANQTKSEQYLGLWEQKVPTRKHLFNKKKKK